MGIGILRNTPIATGTASLDIEGSSRALDPRGGVDARRRELLLHGPIVPTMLRLALPTIVVLLAQTIAGVAETYYVSFLGTDALAGVSLVFPVMMIMVMMSNGGVGGGVASSVARALGAGRRDDADALVVHAIALAVVLGLSFTVGLLIFGPSIYRALEAAKGPR